VARRSGNSSKRARRRRATDRTSEEVLGWPPRKLHGKRTGRSRAAQGQAYGITAVTQALEGLDFPASKRDILNKADDQRIEWTKGHSIGLRDVIQELPDQDYPSMAQVVSTVSDAMDRREGQQDADSKV
jgi:hypothetical protein